MQCDWKRVDLPEGSKLLVTVQALLKAQLGMGVEAWGGHCDHGRDAYFAESLAYPTKGVREAGPFLFQVKFVENANAAGARPAKAILNAIRKGSSFNSQPEAAPEVEGTCPLYPDNKCAA